MYSSYGQVPGALGAAPAGGVAPGGSAGSVGGVTMGAMGAMGGAMSAMMGAVTGMSSAMTAGPMAGRPPMGSGMGMSMSMGMGAGGRGRHGLPASAIHDSGEYGKHALAALREDDPARAAEFFRQALAALGM